MLFLIKKNVLTTGKTLCNCKVLTDSSILAEKSYFETIAIISFPKKENHKFRRGLSFRRGVFAFVGLRFRKGVFVFVGDLRFRRSSFS